MKTHNNPSPAPIWDSRNSDEPPRMRIRCENHDYYLKPDGCPMCRALKAEAELEFLTKEREKLRAMVIRRDRAIQLIHNHTYDPNCPCAVCSMYAAEGWEVI